MHDEKSTTAARIVVTADDYGLTRGVTDTILEAADAGILTRVSILANGTAVDFALAEYLKRKEKLELSLHLNLTEGKPLSAPADIPHLTGRDGCFRYSPIGLLFRSLMPFGRSKLRAEIQLEIEAQLRHVEKKLGLPMHFVDGHQHVHMVPMVCRTLEEVHATHPFRGVRLSREPFFFSKEVFTSLSELVTRHFGLSVLSWWNNRTRNLPFADRFIGLIASGQLTLDNVRAALAEATRFGGGTVEIGTHPGGTQSNELTDWKGNTEWYTSPWRLLERELVMSGEFRKLLDSFVQGQLAPSRALQVARFIVAGGIATATNLGLLYVFTDVAGIWYVFSAVAAYTIAIGVSFTLQKFWTFAHFSREKLRSEIAFYTANNLFGLAFDAVGLYILVEYMDVWYMAAQFVLLFLIATWNFFVYRFVLFK